MNKHNNYTKEYLKFAAVLSAITIMGVALYYAADQNSITDFLRFFMGVFMVVFASFKFFGYKMFVTMFAGYDVVAGRLKLYSYIFPFLQLTIGLIYLIDVIPDYRNILTMVFTGVASIGVFKEVYKRKTGVHCACLGNIIKLPLSTVSFVEDVGMFTMAAVMLVVG